MPTIRFSTSLVTDSLVTGTASVSRLLNTNNITSNNMRLGGGSDIFLRIYSGLRPTWAALTDLNTRSSDLLLTISLPTGQSSWQDLGVVDDAKRFRIAIVTASVTASTTGLATWFVLSTATSSTTTRGALMGDVGGLGSGADLEIVSPNITSGLQYVSGGIYLNFPLSWTF